MPLDSILATRIGLFLLNAPVYLSVYRVYQKDPAREKADQLATPIHLPSTKVSSFGPIWIGSKKVDAADVARTASHI